MRAADTVNFVLGGRFRVEFLFGFSNRRFVSCISAWEWKHLFLRKFLALAHLGKGLLLYVFSDSGPQAEYAIASSDEMDDS